MKRKLFVTLLIALFSVSVAMAGHHNQKVPRAPMAPDAPRHGCGPEMGRPFGGAGKLLHLADKLELTDDQIDKIKEKMEKNGLDRIDQRAEFKKAKLKLRHLKMNDASDKEILSAIEKVGQSQIEMKKQQFMHRSEMKSILTESQQEKLKELRNQFDRDCRPGGKGSRGHGFGNNFEDDIPSYSYGVEPSTPTDEWEY